MANHNLVVAHAGMKEEMQGRGSAAVRSFAMYGETTGETDEFGLPVRYNWAMDYRGTSTVVYGHTPVPIPEWLNNTINIDTGCVFGGCLTALRWPENEIVSVPAIQTYSEPVRPFLNDIAYETGTGSLSAQQEHDDVLDIEDVLGKRLVQTALSGKVTIREENAIAALEVMSRFAADPRWLVYLPPTMSPSETSSEPGMLEHPAEAFAYYRNQGVPLVVCEEKHMGSRCVIVVCKDEETVGRRFGIQNSGIGTCVTRTGRRFFDDTALEQQFLEVIQSAIQESGSWEAFGTDWMLLDCELMPWSAKAQALLRQQYAAVGAAATASMPHAVSVLQMAAVRSARVDEILANYTERAELAHKFVDSYRRYCWPVSSLNDLKLAPFHILASEGKVHSDKNHLWHMEAIARICDQNESDGSNLLLRTQYIQVDVTDESSVSNGITWWEDLASRGGEGMVVKPLDFITMGSRGMVQPAVKCRTQEYLRIIYGPEYSIPINLNRLRSRGLSGKRSMALREFALGMEGLNRFVRKEPLRRVHECVFGVLALESEPVDPRL